MREGEANMKTVIGYAALAMVTLSLISCRHTPEQRAEKIVKVISRQLKLNDDQRAKLEAVKVELKAAREASKPTRAEVLDTLISQVNGKELDAQVLRGLMEQRRAEVDRVSPNVIAKLIEFHATLTEQQKQKLAARLTKFKALTAE